METFPLNEGDHMCLAKTKLEHFRNEIVTCTLIQYYFRMKVASKILIGIPLYDLSATNVYANTEN